MSFDIVLTTDPDVLSGTAEGSSTVVGSVRGVGRICGAVEGSAECSATLGGVAQVCGAIEGEAILQIDVYGWIGKQPDVGNLIFIWPGTRATIPAGWEEEVQLIGRFPFVTDNDDAGSGLGGGTHVHPVSLVPHRVTSTAGTLDVWRNNESSMKGASAAVDHTHPTFYTMEETVNSGAANNTIPVNIRVIFIRCVIPGNTEAPIGAWGFCDRNDGVPAGWTLQNKPYLIAGAAAGQNSNLTPSASPSPHTHSENHGHQTQPSSATDSVLKVGEGIGISAGGHTHPFYMTPTTSDISGTGTPFQTYQKLALIKNDTGSPSLPDGILALMIGRESDRPGGWSVVEFASGFDLIMGVSSLANVGETGGSLGHQHEGAQHVHDRIVVGRAPAEVARNWEEGWEEESAAPAHDHSWSMAIYSIPRNTFGDPVPRSDYPPCRKVLLLKYSTAELSYFTGSIEGSASVVGTVLGTGKVSGAIEGSATVSGVIRGVGRIQGAITGTASVVGTVRGAALVSGAIVGSIVGESVVSGSVQATIVLTYFTGSIVGTAAVVGTVRGTGRVVGSIVGSCSLAARLYRWMAWNLVAKIRLALVRYEDRRNAVGWEPRYYIVSQDDVPMTTDRRVRIAAERRNSYLSICGYGPPTRFFDKDPEAVLDYVVDWAGELDSGDVIEESRWFVSPFGLTISEVAFGDDATIVWLSSGTLGVTYRVRNRITTSDGDVKRAAFDVFILDR